MIQAVFQVPGAFHFLVYTLVFPSWMFILRLELDFLKLVGQERVIMGRTLTPIAGEVLYRQDQWPGQSWDGVFNPTDKRPSSSQPCNPCLDTKWIPFVRTHHLFPSLPPSTF